MHFEFATATRIVFGSGRVGEAEEGVRWVHSMCAALSVPRLSAFGVTRDDLSDIVEKAQKSSSMKGNPVQLTAKELTDILEKAL